MSQVEVWTIGRLLEWTTKFLKDRAAESPRLDAEVLLAHARGCRRIELYTAFEEVPADDVRTRFRELVRQRAEGTPVAYLVGRREFYSLSFRVTPDVLIPRPETELLLVRLLDLIKERATATPASANARVADVGTGSGVLAICTAKRVSGCHVTAIDISPRALDVARENAREHGVDKRMDFVAGDLLAALPAEPAFDYIVSNPPYVSEGEWAKLAREVQREPRGALVAGPTGSETIARLIPQAAARLTSGGWLLTEISPMIEADVRQLFASHEQFEPASTIKDLAGLARIVQARKK